MLSSQLIYKQTTYSWCASYSIYPARINSVDEYSLTDLKILISGTKEDLEHQLGQVQQAIYTADAFSTWEACGIKQDQGSWLAISLEQWTEQTYGRKEHLIPVKRIQDPDFGDFDTTASLSLITITPQDHRQCFGISEHRDMVFTYSDARNQEVCGHKWALTCVTYNALVIFNPRILILKSLARVNGVFAVLLFESRTVECSITHNARHWGFFSPKIYQ